MSPPELTEPLTGANPQQTLTKSGGFHRSSSHIPCCWTNPYCKLTIQLLKLVIIGLRRFQTWIGPMTITKHIVYSIGSIQTSSQEMSYSLCLKKVLNLTRSNREGTVILRQHTIYSLLRKIQLSIARFQKTQLESQLASKVD